MGGEKKKAEKARLRKGLSVVVGTPGRLSDHVSTTQCWDLTRSAHAIPEGIHKWMHESICGAHPTEQVHVQHLAAVAANCPLDKRCLQRNDARSVADFSWADRAQFLILDEADRLMDMGFERDITRICRHVKESRSKSIKTRMQSVLVSATLDSKVRSLASASLTTPTIVSDELMGDAAVGQILLPSPSLPRLPLSPSSLYFPPFSSCLSPSFPSLSRSLNYSLKSSISPSLPPSFKRCFGHHLANDTFPPGSD